MIRHTLFLILFGIGLFNNMNAQTITVMSYNIRLDVASDGENAWPYRAKKVAALMNKNSPDIVGVQEALGHQLRELLVLLPQYTYVGVGRDDGQDKGEYSAILFLKKRFEWKKDSTFWLSETPTVPGSKSWDAAITRIATMAILTDHSNKKELLVINTHFDHMGKEARAHSAQLITKTATYYHAKVGLPIIVSGDFNSERDELAYQNMVKTGLKDSKPADDATGTYCGFEVGKLKCNPIDFIFYSQEWSLESYQVINDHDGKFYPSDHLPVIATLKWQKH